MPLMRTIKFASLLIIPLIAACTTPPSSHVPETPDHIQQPTPSAIDNCSVGCPLGGSNTTLYRQAYTLNNNGSTKFANWVAYKITKQTPASGRPRNWKTDPEVPSGETLSPADYKGASETLKMDRGPTRLWRKQSKRESESVRASLIAEIAALVDIVELRRFLPALREKQALLAARQTATGAFRRDPESYEVRIDSQFNRVYQASVTKLGMLTAEEARQIVRFHQLADSVRLDVIPGGDLATGTDSAEKFGAAADLLEMALVIGHALVDSKKSGS